jgi:hypothetical protein
MKQDGIKTTPPDIINIPKDIKEYWIMVDILEGTWSLITRLDLFVFKWSKGIET